MLIHKFLTMCMAFALVATNANAQQNLASPPSQPNPKGTQPAVKQVAGPHGGQLQQVGTLQVETIVELGGLRLYAYDNQRQPLDMRAGRGLATLQLSGDAKRYRYDLYAEIGRDKTAQSLAVAIDLTRVAGQQVDLVFQLVGLPGAERRPLKFKATATVPMTKAQQIAANQSLHFAPATAEDAAAIAHQKVCPVMGESLGSMGTPVKVTGLQRDVFLCCKGCVKFLKKEPLKYLAKLPAPLGATKPSLVKATKVDAQFVANQKLCPVMDEPLEAMGGPYKTVVAGRVVYLCCPGCLKKLHATPAVYLKKLAKQGVEPPLVR